MRGRLGRRLLGGFVLMCSRAVHMTQEKNRRYLAEGNEIKNYFETSHPSRFFSLLQSLQKKWISTQDGNTR